MTAVPARISSISARRSGERIGPAADAGLVVIVTSIIYLTTINSSTATISITGSIARPEPRGPRETEKPNAICADDRAAAGLLLPRPAGGRATRRGRRIRDVPALRPLRQLSGRGGAADDRRMGRA